MNTDKHRYPKPHTMPSKEKFCLEVSGDFACFTRPEMKVERVSYDVITPSAARGVFEAILWKRGMSWQIESIEVLRPINWVNIRRNEVGGVASTRKEQIFVEDDRQQRAGLFLRDVAYRLHARFELCGESTATHSYPKYAEMFKRRAAKGQCFNQPYLGTREFAAAFRYIAAEQLAAEQSRLPPIADSRDLGWMLYDLDFQASPTPDPMFFHARMENGSISVPRRASAEVRK